MIDRTAAEAILEQYARHGWELRRVLLTGEASADIREFFAGKDVRDAEIEALWFARRSRQGSETWELRRLGGSPFALVAVIEDGTGDDERESQLSATEGQLSDVARRLGETGH
ncbi:MAG TPA: hypothetical protein VK918_03015 [Pyrinomonadaceae bacterium]|nr:hypothetical protein [Pyrinomonadaceae bacterium]